MNFIVSASTDIGNTKSSNQDSLHVKVISTPLGRMVFAIMCDGMGGLEKGEVASASVVHAYSKWSEEVLPDYCLTGMEDTQIREDWCNIAVTFNEKIKLYGKKSGINLGTTVTVMLITSTRYYILNVGDTRAYEITDSLQVLTKDQTVVEREIQLGHLTREEAERDQRRSVLLQCIGASDAVYPDMYYGDTQMDAVYMLCTDGFRHEISPNEIYSYFCPNNMLDAEGMKNNELTLIDLNKRRNERDNISVITIRTF